MFQFLIGFLVVCSVVAIWYGVGYLLLKWNNKFIQSLKPNLFLDRPVSVGFATTTIIGLFGFICWCIGSAFAGR